jgi:hypothetical protein
MKFKVTFVDIFEAEDESKSIDDLLSYLKECVKMEDVTAFGFEEIKDE